MENIKDLFPKTINDAVDRLISELSFKDKTKIANMPEVELIKFNTSWGIYVRNEFRLPGNDSLLESCKSYAGLNKISPDQAAFIIVKALWEKLQHSNVLKIVK